MKKIFVFLISLFMLPIIAYAGSGTINVTGTSTAVVGNKVTITVTLSSNVGIGSWQMQLDYDKNYLQLTSSSAENGGTVMANSTTSGISKKTYTFTFKTLKTGSTNVSVSSYLAYAFDDLSQISLTSSSKSISIITQAELEASYSKDNNLKSLSVEGFDISPEFNKDTLEYSITVPEDTKTIKINASVEDSTASITGTGEFEVTQGSNTFLIVVKAQNGSEKTYTLNVSVIDSNPIEVTVNDIDYTVVKVRENLPLASNYQEYSVIINDIEIPAYKSEVTSIVLVGLKDSSGNIKLFIYDEESKEYSTYNEIGINKLTIYLKDTNKVIDGYKSKTITINDVELNCLYYNEDSEFVLIYGVDIDTNEEGYFVYDTKTQVISRYNDEVESSLNKKIQLYTYIIIGFISLLILLFLILIFVLKKGFKRKKINKEDNNKNKKKRIKSKD